MHRLDSSEKLACKACRSVFASDSILTALGDVSSNVALFWAVKQNEEHRRCALGRRGYVARIERFLCGAVVRPSIDGAIEKAHFLARNSFGSGATDCRDNVLFAGVH